MENRSNDGDNRSIPPTNRLMNLENPGKRYKTCFYLFWKGLGQTFCYIITE